MDACEKFFMRFGQLAVLVFSATFSVVGIYCYLTDALVGKDTSRVNDEKVARNELLICNMAVVGGFATLSLLGSILCRCCSGGKSREFCEQTWPVESKDKQNKFGKKVSSVSSEQLDKIEKGVSADFFVEMLEKYELDADNYHCLLGEPDDPQKTVEHETSAGLVRRGQIWICGWQVPKICPWSSMVNSYVACHKWQDKRCKIGWMVLGSIINVVLLMVTPFWWYWRIFMHPMMDFSENNLNDDVHYKEMWPGRHENDVLGFAATGITIIGISFFLWHHCYCMVDSWFMSRWAAWSLTKKILEKTQDMKQPEGVLATRKEIDWGEMLCDLINLKKNLERFWAHPPICVPWITFFVAGMACVLLGISVMLTDGIDLSRAMPRMALGYFCTGCFVVLTLLFALSDISCKFYKESSSPSSMKGAADLFLLEYVKLQNQKYKGSAEHQAEEADATGHASIPPRHYATGMPPSSGPPHQDSAMEEFIYIEHHRDFVNYLRNEMIGVRLPLGIMCTRAYAMLALKTMISSLGIIFVMHKGLLKYLKDQLNVCDRRCDHMDNISSWLDNEMPKASIDLCCKVRAAEELFCLDPAPFRDVFLVMKDVWPNKSQAVAFPLYSELKDLACEELHQHNETMPKFCGVEPQRLFFLQQGGAVEVAQGITASAGVLALGLVFAGVVGLAKVAEWPRRRSVSRERNVRVGWISLDQEMLEETPPLPPL